MQAQAVSGQGPSRIFCSSAFARSRRPRVKGQSTLRTRPEDKTTNVPRMRRGCAESASPDSPSPLTRPCLRIGVTLPPSRPSRPVGLGPPYSTTTTRSRAAPPYADLIIPFGHIPIRCLEF
jgi:hypothetical protein